MQVRHWPAWKCVECVAEPSYPGTPTPVTTLADAETLAEGGAEAHEEAGAGAEARTEAVAAAEAEEEEEAGAGGPDVAADVASVRHVLHYLSTTVALPALRQALAASRRLASDT